MTAASPPIAPGAQVVVRDAVWRVVQVDRTSNGTNAFTCRGVSEIVRDQSAVFLEEYEPPISVLDPCTTALVPDRSPGHRAGLLYMESLLRDVPPVGPELHVGQRAAMDVLDFQLEPALKALSRPRPRILIADAVGLGKTLEAGILLAELMRRGRARRILVATVRSMLTQFQKELWCRFAIPLVRLDSEGLQRVRDRIPTNHNPFYYYDKTIISIDTLKQNNAFRTHVEKAWWDVIVIDEAHNVAARGGGRSQRARIAELLAERSDALILLSATPHDGKARSFASLMNMLDPTAIADPDDYTPGEISGLFIRRFKKDVQQQVGKAFPERVIARAHAPATPAEEAAFARLAELSFTRLDRRAHGDMLFRTTLEKALFSSPAACLQTLDERLRRLRTRPDAVEFAGDAAQLEAFAAALRAIGPESFGKYRKLLELLRDDARLAWSPRKRDDRLVIFSERIETLRFLEEHLKRDLKLTSEQVAVLHAEGMSDVEQQHTVEAFGKLNAPVRLLLASNVAAEGLNLHYLCHKLVHFDVPWSLMIFQQRNGRIDRYGQERTPFILYLLTDAQHPKVRGDARILELLVERDEQATKNIGDPSALMGVYDIDAEERITAAAIEQGLSAGQFDAQLEEGRHVDPLELLLGAAHELPAPAERRTKELLSLFPSDFDYVERVLEHLAETEGVQREVRRADAIVELHLPPDLRRRFAKLPVEVDPPDGVAVLTPDRTMMQRATADARREETAWPRLQFLWPLNPVVEWCNDKARAAFGRHTAPVLTLVDGLDPAEAVVVVSGLVPNRRSQPVIHRWYAVRFRDGQCVAVEDFGDFARALGLGRRQMPNRNVPADLAALAAFVTPAVAQTRAAVLQRREEFERRVNPLLDAELTRLEAMKARQQRQLELRFEDVPGQRHTRDREARRIQRIFDNYVDWIENTLCTEPVPFLQVIAVLRPEPRAGGVA